MNLYSFGEPIVAVFFHLFFRLNVKGQNAVPSSGPALICCNHLSNYDPPLIGVSVKRQLSFIAKEELFRIPLFGHLLRHLHAYPIKRGSGDRGAIRKGLELLANGHVLLIFPEGKRNRSGHLLKGLSGAGFFALKSNAVVIPCAIKGDYRFRSQLTVSFGKPLDIGSMKEKSLRSAEVSAEIMKQIQKLLDTGE